MVAAGFSLRKGKEPIGNRIPAAASEEDHQIPLRKRIEK